jgi:hypothetical protein
MLRAVPVEPRWASRVIFGVSFFAVAVRLFFWYYTRRTWEDGLITVQHAENAARGLGLTHVAGGPHVHGFTSPISVLIPLLGELAHPGFGLPLLRLVSAVCGGVTVWLAMRISQRLGLAFPISLLIGGYLAIEHQQILFGMAGMETQVAVTILFFSIYSLFDLKPIHVGISLGLCMLVRPDFGFWVVIVIALVGWRCWNGHDLGPLETILLALLLIYGPWLAFTTWYYGSPLPNTVLAKAWGYENRWYAGLSASGFLLTVIGRVRQIFATLGTVYWGNGGSTVFFLPFGGLICFAVLLFVLVGMAVAGSRKDLLTLAIAGFVLVYSLYYLFLMGVVFPWYCVPLAAVAMLAGGIGLDILLKDCFAERWRPIPAYALTIAYLASLVAVAAVTFRGEKNVQAFVEDGVRKQVGLYLAGVTRPSETIGSESLGYVGYYSRRVVYDYPGLCNRQVVRFEREHPTKHKLLDMLAYFHPDYIVLRPAEYLRGLKQGQSWLLTDYQQVASFRVPEEKRSQLLFPEGNIDLEFYVLKRGSYPLEGYSASPH